MASRGATERHGGFDSMHVSSGFNNTSPDGFAEALRLQMMSQSMAPAAARPRLRSKLQAAVASTKLARTSKLAVDRLRTSSRGRRSDDAAPGSVLGLGDVILADAEHNDLQFFLCHEGTDESETAARQLEAALIAARTNISTHVDVASDDVALTAGPLQLSNALVLLLSEHVLAQPRCLLQIYLARRARLPIIPVEIEGAGYQFTETKRFLQRLEKGLPATSRAHLASLLETADLVRPLPNGLQPGVGALGLDLSKTLPALIAVKIRPDASESHCKAVAKDVIGRYMHVNRSRRRVSCDSCVPNHSRGSLFGHSLSSAAGSRGVCGRPGSVASMDSRRCSVGSVGSLAEPSIGSIQSTANSIRASAHGVGGGGHSSSDLVPGCAPSWAPAGARERMMRRMSTGAFSLPDSVADSMVDETSVSVMAFDWMEQGLDEPSTGGDELMREASQENSVTVSP